MASKESVKKFLSEKHIAVAGVSRKGNAFGNNIYKELKQKDYVLYQVNPHADEINGEKCYRNISDLPNEVSGIVLSVKPEQSVSVIKEAYSKGIKNVWMLFGVESEEAIKFCEENEINYIINQCILMYAEPVAAFHKFHGFFWKLLGRYAK